MMGRGWWGRQDEDTEGRTQKSLSYSVTIASRSGELPL